MRKVLLLTVEFNCNNNCVFCSEADEDVKYKSTEEFKLNNSIK